MWRIAPRSSRAMSVVPPPMSMIRFPISFSSAVSVASAAASCSRTVSSTSMPARLTQFTMFWTEETEPVTM